MIPRDYTSYPGGTGLPDGKRRPGRGKEAAKTYVGTNFTNRHSIEIVRIIKL